MKYEEFLTSLLVDLVAISLLTYGLYYRRHRRRDLTLGLMGVNVGLFAVSSFTATSTMSVGFGIGLFALLSVIRLRSTTASQEEIGYYFVALVIGLVNGLSIGNGWDVTITLNIVLLAVMFVADHPRMLQHVERHHVVLKGTPHPRHSLRAELEDRLGYEVTKMHVLEIDYSRKRMTVDVRINTAHPVAKRARAKHHVEHAAATHVEPDVTTDTANGATSDPTDTTVGATTDTTVEPSRAVPHVRPPEEVAP